MRRRSFLSITGLANMAGVWKRERQPQIGFITADMYGAQDIKKITLDGRDVDRVFELDDVEGWVRFYTPGENGKICRREGEIEIFWKDEKIPIQLHRYRTTEERAQAKREADEGNRFDLDEWEAEEKRREDKCRSSDVRRAGRRGANSGQQENASQALEEEPKPQDRGELSSDPKA